MMFRIDATPLSDFLYGLQIRDKIDLSVPGLIATEFDGLTLWIFPSDKMRAIVRAAQ